MAEIPEPRSPPVENRAADFDPPAPGEVGVVGVPDPGQCATNDLRSRLWFRQRWKLSAVLGFALLIGAIITLVLGKSEPRYNGHSLSFWLDALDANMRFSDQPERRSPFTDEQVERALDSIGVKAFPFLMAWFFGEQPGWRARLLKLLEKQRYLRLSARDGSNLGTIAETGFVYYGPRAKALQPALLKLTQSEDSGKRLKAYEAFFFTRPDRQLFLPVCRAALSEPDEGVQLMAAQWVTERFPEDAKQLGIDKKFPEYYRAWTDSQSRSTSPTNGVSTNGNTEAKENTNIGTGR